AGHHRPGVRRLEEGHRRPLRRGRPVRPDLQAHVTDQAILPRPVITGAPTAKRRRAPWVQHSILPGFGLSLGITLVYLGAIVVLPLIALAIRPWELGLDGVWHALTAPRVAAALRLS